MIEGIFTTNFIVDYSQRFTYLNDQLDIVKDELYAVSLSSKLFLYFI